MVWDSLYRPGSREKWQRALNIEKKVMQRLQSVRGMDGAIPKHRNLSPDLSEDETAEDCLEGVPEEEIEMACNFLAKFSPFSERQMPDESAQQFIDVKMALDCLPLHVKANNLY